jgi:site-specific DNA-methyltransferase (cytosine-N4-specific)
MIELYNEDCVQKLTELPDTSIDAIFTDPPYPEINREYGKMNEDSWMLMMQQAVLQFRRVLKPLGSAVIILQPNSSKLGSMRSWYWEFMAWAIKEWNLIQDVSWFNPAAQPTRHANRKYGLMRPSVKSCIWLGAADCYRCQDAVLLPLKIKEHKKSNELIYRPSGHHMRAARCLNTAIERGGSTPFNLLQIPNTYDKRCAGSFGHGAGTPYRLTEWWLKYITKPGDTVLDPFSGVATTGLVCRDLGRSYIGIEKFAKYHEVATQRLLS